MNKYISLIGPNDTKTDFLKEFIQIFLKDSRDVKKYFEVLQDTEYNRLVRLSNHQNKNEYDSKRFKELQIKFNNISTNPNEVLGVSLTQYALINKVEHILFYKGGLLDVLVMLNRFKEGVKRLKTCQVVSTHEDQYNYIERDGNEK